MRRFPLNTRYWLLVLSIPIVTSATIAQTIAFESFDLGGSDGAFRSVFQDGPCLIAVGSGMYRSCDEGATWVMVRDGRGMLPVGVLDGVVHRPSGKLLILTIGSMQALDRPDGAWRLVLSDAGDENTRDLIPSRVGTVVYALSAKRLRRSIDAGETWVDALTATGQFDALARPVACDTSGRFVVAAQGNAVYASVDSGNTWRHVADSVWNGSKPIVFVTFGGAILLGNRDGDLLRSTDSGATWSSAAVDPGSAVSSISQPSASEIIVGTGGGQIFASSDDGLTWTREDDSHFSRPIIAAERFEGGALLVSQEYHDESLSLLDEVGGVWRASTRGIATDVLIKPLVTGSTIYTATRGAALLYRSDDGRQWVRDSIPLYGASIRSLGSFRPEEIIASLSGQGLARRRAPGSTWELIQKGLPDPFSRSAFAFAQRDSEDVWIATGNGLYRSVDGGDNWTGTMGGLTFTSIAIRKSDGLLLAGTDQKSAHELMYASRDGGASIEVSNAGLSGSVKEIAFCPNGSAIAATVGGLFISQDDGREWSRLKINAYDSVFVGVVTDRWGSVYAATENVVYVSRDTGSSWTPVFAGLNGGLSGLALDSTGHLFVSTIGGGLLRSLSPISQAVPDRRSNEPAIIVQRFGETLVVESVDCARINGAMYSVLGAHVLDFEGAIGEDRLHVPIGELPSGVYVVSTRCGDASETHLVTVGR